MNPKVWEASGHVGGFADLMVDCKKCNRRFRADKVFFGGMFGEGPSFPVHELWPPKGVLAVEANDKGEAESLLKAEQARLEKKKKIAAGLTLMVHPATEVIPKWKRTCPAEGCDGELTEPRQFNLMLDTYPGAIKDE